jgi:hypothetical protein
MKRLWALTHQRSSHPMLLEDAGKGRSVGNDERKPLIYVHS